MRIRTAKPDGLIHHERHGGAAPAVVLVHGMACSGTDWDAQVAHQRAAGRDVLTVDLRGHGHSTAFEDGFDMGTLGTDVAAVLRASGIRSAIVAGHSMGCRVATETALAVPGIVRGLLLVDGSRFARGDGDAAVDGVRAVLDERGVRTHMDALFDTMFLPGADEALRARIIDRARDCPDYIATALLLSMVRWDAEQFARRYGALQVPVHVIQSTHVTPDRTRVPVTADMSIQWHEELLACGVKAAFERVPDCGHFTMLDAPTRVNAALDALLLQVS